MMGKQDRLQISGRLLAKNTLLNFIGQAVPLLGGVRDLRGRRLMGLS